MNGEMIESTRALADRVPARVKTLFAMLEPDAREEVLGALVREIEGRARTELARLGQRADLLRSALDGTNGATSPPADPPARRPLALPAPDGPRAPEPEKPRRGPARGSVVPGLDRVLEAIDALGGRGTRSRIRRHFEIGQGTTGDRAIARALVVLEGEGKLVEDGRVQGGGVVYKRPRADGGGEALVPDDGRQVHEEARQRAALTESAARDAARAGQQAEQTARERRVVSPGAGIETFREREQQLDRQIVAVLGQGPAMVTQVMQRLKQQGVQAPSAIVARRLQELERSGELAKSPPAIYRVAA